MKLSVSLEGDARNILSILEGWEEFRDPDYDVMRIDYEPVGSMPWEDAFRTAKKDAYVYWYEKYCQPPSENVTHQIGFRPHSNVVTFSFFRFRGTLDDAITRIETLPFKVAVMGNIYAEPGKTADAWNARYVDRWGFSRSMIDHGWGCAFRSVGHARLVSRRWLDFGPWRVIRRPNDTTFIQFHDLAITDPAEAYAQAAPGHQRMGIDVIGGYLQQVSPERMAEIESEVQGLYLPDHKRLEIIVAPGVEVTQQAMRLACGLRLHHRLTQPTSGRIDTIAYIFIDEAEARAHLHELWLRELECWYISPTGKHRLDADYHPVPNPPDWVKRLDGK